MNFEQLPDESYPTAKRNNFKKLKCEIYRDNMQNYKKYAIPRCGAKMENKKRLGIKPP